jgi:hypothetical protein
MNTEETVRQNGNTVVAKKPDGNPEGKGVSGLMQDWRRSEPRGVVAKPRQQVLAELFTSLLVLSAPFRFRPAAGNEYYLYWMEGEWSLSLIAPHEWTDARRAGYVGACVLQRDMTWTMTPCERLAQKPAVREAIGRFYDGFAETLDTDLPLEDVLPFYAGGVGYYQRLFASALSRSVRKTVSMDDQAAANCRQWHALLPEVRALVAMPGVTP